jgi:hypothetical protein
MDLCRGELGYRCVWFFDTQMLNSELFVAMTAAALNTTGSCSPLV